MESSIGSVVGGDEDIYFDGPEQLDHFRVNGQGFLRAFITLYLHILANSRRNFMMIAYYLLPFMLNESCHSFSGKNW